MAAGLIAIREQFNNSTSGFVNEAFIAKILDGQTVPVGTGGIEDVQIKQGDLTIGISLKTKKVAKFGGSLTQLLETMGVSFYKEARESKSKKGGYSHGIWRVRNTTDTFISEEHTRESQPMAFASVDPKPVVDVLYYLSFFKTGSAGITIKTHKITKDDFGLSAADPIQIEDHVYYDLSKINDILGMKVPVTKEQASYDLVGDYTIEGFNNALRENAAEVLDSLMVLDAWYGKLKEDLIKYVSNLEKESFQDLQTHLRDGAQYTFKAFDLDSCD